MNTRSSTYIGCAGWTLRKPTKNNPKLSHLEEYTKYFNCVEINSSFYRLHKPGTYFKWASLVPSHFRFSIKIPRAISHDTKLREPELLIPFLAGVSQLGHKRGPLLLQLPGKLVFERRTAEDFLIFLKKHYSGRVVCEPRHESWFGANARSLLERFNISIVSADPSPVGKFLAGKIRGDLHYLRLHGSPRMYYSEYSPEFLSDLANQIRQESSASQVWVVFDNTAAGHAFSNARHLAMCG